MGCFFYHMALKRPVSTAALCTGLAGLSPVHANAAVFAAAAAVWPWLGGVAMLIAGTALVLRYRRRKSRAPSAEVRSTTPDMPGVLPDLLFEMDLEGRYVACHHVLHPELLSAPLDQLIGRTVRDAMPAEAADTAIDALREAHETGFSNGKQICLPLPQGERWFELSVARKPNPAGSLPRFSVLSRDITGRKRAEIALNQERATLRAFVRALPQLAWMKDRQGRYLLCNPLFEEFFGASETDIVGKTDFDFVDASLATFFRQKDVEAMEADGPRVNEEWITYASNGRLALLETTKLAVRDADGQVIGVIGVANEITERRRMEDALRTSEARYRALIEKIHAAVVVHDADMRIIVANPVAQQILGMTEAQLLGASAFDPHWAFFHEDGRPATAEEYPANRVMTTAQPVRNMVLGLNHPHTGTKVWALVNADPVIGDDGQVVQVIVTFVDISQRKLAERDLHLLTKAVNASSDAAYITDASGRFVYVSDTACKALGRSREDLLKMGPADIDASIPAEAIHRMIQQSVSSTAAFDRRFETRHRRSDGHVFPVEISASAIEFDGVRYALAVARDISERLRHESALIESEQRYREVFDNVSDSLYLLEVTTEGRFKNLKVNPAFELSTGLSNEQLVGKFIDEATTPENADAVLKKYRRCVETGVAYEEEVTLTLPSGQRRYLSTLIPVRNAEGRIHRIVGISRDVTLRQRHDELVRKLARLAELAPGFFFTYLLEDRSSGRGVFQYASPGVWDVLGLTPQQLLDNASLIYQSMLPGESCRVEKALAESARTMLPCVIEYRARHATLGERWVELRTTPEWNSEGKLLWHGYFNDITERKAAERELSDSYRMLQELTSLSETTREEERKRIAREVHDELGQRLTALRLSLAMLRLQHAEYQPELAQNLQNLINTVDSTIQVARHVTSALRPSALNMGLRPALEWLASEFSQYSDTPCHTDLAPGITELSEAQATAAFRVAQESLTNIARHAQATQATIRFRDTSSGHLLEILDDGRGFDPRMPGARSLGLAGMRERGIMLGGEVEIISAPGQGTTVRLRIPLNAEARPSSDQQ
jgi:PAS domain S-box-containing protein